MVLWPKLNWDKFQSCDMWKLTIEINQLDKIQDIQFRVTFATQKINKFRTDISNIKIKDWPISDQIQSFW